MSRDDLRELSVEALTALANPGFVRRARRDLDAGRAPALEVGEDGVITARFADGVRTALPPGAAIKDADCTCAASGWCRHRVTLVLAYQDLAGAVGAVGADGLGSTGRGGAAERAWSPGAFDDEALAAAVPGRILDRARRSAAVTVRLSAPGGVPTAHLPMNVVQFFSSSSLAHARCDCRETGGCEHLALAVRAFREAGARMDSATAGRVSVQVGSGAEAASLAEELSAVRPQVAAACREVLLAGADNADAGVLAVLDRATEQVRRLGWSWAVGDLEGIARQLEARRARSTAADPALLAALLAEAPARLAAAAAALASSEPGRDEPGGDRPARPAAPDRPAAEILGIGVPGVVELAHLRLVSLGARCWSAPGREGGARVGIQVFLLDPDTGQVSVLERSWDGDEPARQRRLLGTTAARIARSQLVTAAAGRRALGVLEIGADRRRTSINPLGPRSWPLAGAGDRDRSPAFVRSRRLGDRLVTVAVTGVEQWGWDPAAQRLDAVLRTPDGAVALELVHTPAEPGAVDAVASVLADGALRAVSGQLRSRGGMPVLTPLALATDDRAVVPAVQPEPEHPVPLPRAPGRGRGPHGDLVAEARRRLAGWLHRGIRQQGRAALQELTGLSAELAEAGLLETSELVASLARTVPEDPAAAADLMLRLILLLDALDARL